MNWWSRQDAILRSSFILGSSYDFCIYSKTHCFISIMSWVSYCCVRISLSKMYSISLRVDMVTWVFSDSAPVKVACGSTQHLLSRSCLLGTRWADFLSLLITWQIFLVQKLAVAFSHIVAQSHIWKILFIPLLYCHVLSMLPTVRQFFFIHPLHNWPCIIFNYICNTKKDKWFEPSQWTVTQVKFLPFHKLVVEEISLNSVVTFSQISL